MWSLKWKPRFNAMFAMISVPLGESWGNTVLLPNTRFWGGSHVPLAQKLTSISRNWPFTMMLYTWNWQIILVKFVENYLEGRLLSELTWTQFTLRRGELTCKECLLHSISKYHLLWHALLTCSASIFIDSYVRLLEYYHKVYINLTYNQKNAGRPQIEY